MKPVSCVQCGNPLSIHDKFCSKCGAARTKSDGVLINCSKCNHQNPTNAAFCEKCGNRLDENISEKKATETKTPNKIISKGSYSDKMVKGKTSKGWKLFKNILLIIVLFAVISLVIWFQVDPDAGKKLTDALMGIAFMAVFFFVGWLFMRGKKGKGRGGNDDYDWDHNDDNDFDSDDDDD
jgi:uncharacterized membrane protein YvbJ